MDWTKWQDKAVSMLSKYGIAMSARVYTTGVYSPASDSLAETYVDYACTGVLTELKEKDVDKTLIQEGDQMLIISAKGLPALADQERVAIISGSRTWNPIGIKAVAPGGTAIIYKLHVRA